MYIYISLNVLEREREIMHFCKRQKKQFQEKRERENYIISSYFPSKTNVKFIYYLLFGRFLCLHI